MAINLFAEIIIVTNSETTRKRIENIGTQVLNDLGKDSSCKRSNVNFQVKVCPVTNKREQLVIGIKAAKTELIVLADDHVFFKPQFVTDVTSVFEKPLVGLCGTRKSVRRQALKATTVWGKYWKRYWNFLGSTYLAQNDFRARCTNAADGGVNVVSGRALFVRRKIVQDPKFISKYLNERFLFGLFGPLNSDDDNFLTRWVTKEGWEIKIQDTYEATVKTTLGQQHKFIGQCLRWARTTYRSNLCSLLTDRTAYAALTFYVTDWTGRKLDNPDEISFSFALSVDGVPVKGKEPVNRAQKTIRTI
ncbi:hypothetical protein RRF57_009091 [Xylaria bambusicola]|uniref:Uncharacterized protein n=1 Tax=Xylaria bambusicola TaxID=326684 RepID=A0AAN7Z7K9_9PEZI